MTREDLGRLAYETFYGPQACPWEAETESLRERFRKVGDVLADIVQTECVTKTWEKKEVSQ